MKNNLSNRRKAKLLRTLYRENLTRLVYRYSTKDIVTLSDIAEAHSSKSFLISYLLYLVSEFPNTELAVEALFILENSAAMQENFADNFKNTEIEATCNPYNPYEINPLVKLICLIYKDYKHNADIYGLGEKSFYTLRIKILDYAAHSDKNKYGLNEIYWRKLLLANEDELYATERIEPFLKYFSMIDTKKNPESLYSIKEYNNLKKLIEKKKFIISEFTALEKELSISEKKTSDLQSRMKMLLSERSKLMRDLLSKTYPEEYYEKLKEREKTVLYSGE